MITAAQLNALRTGFKVEFQKGFDQMSAETAYKRIATVVPSSSGKETYGWLGKFPKMRKWVGARVYQQMKESGYVIENEDFESTVAVGRNHIEDDELGMYGPLMRSMGQEAAIQPDDLTFGTLKDGRTNICFDGQYFFDTDHPTFDEEGNAAVASNVDASGAADNPWWYLLDDTKALKPLIFQDRKKAQFVAKTDATTSDHVFDNKEFVYGVDVRNAAGYGFWQMAYASNAALDGDSLDAAIEQMRSLRDENGRPLGMKPSLLVVGPKLRSQANKTVKVMLSDGGASNANYNAVDVLDTDWVA